MSADEASRADPAPSRIRWRIPAVLIVVSLVSYLLLGNLLTAAPTMKDDLELTEIQ